MTVAMLLENTVISATRFLDGLAVPMNYLPLNVKTPVPNDLDIAQSQTPKLISTLAEELGILPSELEVYGKYKVCFLLIKIGKSRLVYY